MICKWKQSFFPECVYTGINKEVGTNFYTAVTTLDRVRDMVMVE